MRQIAYKSDIGERRRQFCEKARVHLLICQQRVHRAITEGAAARGQTIYCKPGCSACCSHYVTASLQEAEAIVHFLYENPEQLEQFLNQWRGWKERTEGEKRFVAVDRLKAGVKNGDGLSFVEFDNAQDIYRRLDIACPFLIENRCIIYPVRPMVCVNLASLTPPENCLSKSKIRPTYVTAPFTVTGPAPLPYFLGSQTRVIVASVPVIVFNLLLNGYLFMKHQLGIEEIEQELLKDPETFEALLK